MTEKTAYDVVVIGGGAAGLGGALALSRARRSVLVVDEGTPRNARAEGVHNYLGREGTPPAELLAIGRAEVAGYGGELVTGTVRAAAGADGDFRIELDAGTVRARKLLVAVGGSDELPDVAGLAERWGTTCCTARTATGTRCAIGRSGSSAPGRWPCTRRCCGGSGART